MRAGLRPKQAVLLHKSLGFGGFGFWLFFCFLGSCKVLRVSLWIWELILWPRGHPLGRVIFFFSPFLGVDARSGQQKAAETEADERASPGTSLPVSGGHQPGMAAPELPGEEEQGALAPILAGEGWRSSSSMEQHPRGASITPLRGQAIPGHGPQRILQGCPSPRTPTLPTPKLDAVLWDDPSSPGRSLTPLSPLASFSPRSP